MSAAWDALLQGLPNEPWDVFTDFSRERGHAASLEACRLKVVPIQVEKHDDLDLIVAFCVALAASDRGRETVWILDDTDADPRSQAFPLCADLRKGTLEQLRRALQEQRAHVADLCRSSHDSAAEARKALHLLAPPNRFATRAAHPICQAAVTCRNPASLLNSASPSPPPDFSLVVGGDAAELAYRADLFEEATASFMARHIVALLDRWREWPETALTEVAALLSDDGERELVLESWNDTTTPFDSDLCVHELFERCARSSKASNVAVVPAGEEEPTWSYAQLDIAAGQVASDLLRVVPEDGSRVALLAPRSPAMVAAIYGILRAGCAYVPLDSDWPPERQRVIIEDVEAAAIVVSVGLSAPSGCESVPVISLRVDSKTTTLHVSTSGRPQEKAAREAAKVNPQMSAYILYTSGTTGKPKGVDVPHYGLVGRTEWLQHTWNLTSKDVVAQKTPATFAISEWELFWPLCYGARIALAEARLHGDPQHVATLMERQEVSHAVFVPSMLDQLLDELDGRPLPSLQLILACGEALKVSVMKACLKGLPDTELVNLYGPTEGTMTMLRIPKEPTEKHLLRSPIGVPIENTQILCASGPPPRLPPSPVLVHGELVFGGPLIAAGYWRLPELTKEKFVDNPHRPGKAYRSGDLGRWRADATLEFLGRLDNQVKFNGVRIELGELESAVAGVAGVRSAAAFLSPPHLVVACTLEAGAGGGDSASLETERGRILEGLRAALPRDRVPTRVEILPAMPTTDRGKVDRKKLLDGFVLREAERAKEAAAARSAAAQQDASDANRSETEVAIEDFMRDLLQVEETLPATTRFQDLGFSSLLLGKLTTRVRRKFGLPGLPATAVYRAPSLRQLATLVDEERKAEEDVNLTASAMVPVEEVWMGESSTSMLSCVCTGLGLLCQSIICEFAFLPAYYALFGVFQYYGLYMLCLVFAPILFLDAFLTLAVAVALKWTILGKCREGSWPVFGWFYWKWWFVHEIEHFVQENVAKFVADTVLFSAFLVLMGARVGGGTRLNMVNIGNADLVTIGSNVRVEREATISPSRIRMGQLYLQRVSIGSGSHIGHRAHLPGGSSVGVESKLVPMASSDENGPHHVMPYKGQATRPSAMLTILQIFLGLPLLMIVEGLAEVPVVFALFGIWKWLAARLTRKGGRVQAQKKLRPLKKLKKIQSNIEHAPWLGYERGYTLEGKQEVLYPFLMAIPWVMTFVHGFTYYLTVVIIKWLLVGRFREGPVQGDWDVFRRWLLERLTTTATFDHFMELWVNTEMLALWYRLLGANVASRVNMDFFGAVEYDLIEVERDVVFGSSVLLVTTADGLSNRVVLRKSACVLDHSCVMPGVVVPEGALLGSFTVAPSEQKLEAMTVYMGCEKGLCVRLFQRPLLPGERIIGERVFTEDVRSSEHELLRSHSLAVESVAALKQRELEALAAARHSSTFWFVLFNLWCALSAAIFAPLPDIVYWATIIIDFEVYDAFRDSDLGEVVSVSLIGPIYVLVTFAMLAVICGLKWALIGRWTAGDRPYYTWFHFRWAALMVAFSSLDDLVQAIAGTGLSVIFMRLMGAKVGNQVCFFGHGFEYDLLHIGDNVCIGPDCDVTAHTVENMVMKLEHVRFERGSSCMGGSVVMPGGIMEPWSTLIEHSQVLKGETVPRAGTFGGLPARLLRGHRWHTPQEGGAAPGSLELPVLRDGAAGERLLAQSREGSPTSTRALLRDFSMLGGATPVRPDVSSSRYESHFERIP